MQARWAGQYYFLPWPGTDFRGAGGTGQSGGRRKKTPRAAGFYAISKGPETFRDQDTGGPRCTAARIVYGPEGFNSDAQEGFELLPIPLGSRRFKQVPNRQDCGHFFRKRQAGYGRVALAQRSHVC